MNIYLLYKTDDMKNMTQADVHDIRNTLEGSLKIKPVYDLAIINGVLWRVGAVEPVSSKESKTLSKRVEIPSNTQGFRGTALDPEGNTVNEEYIYKMGDGAARTQKKRCNIS